MRNIRQRAEGSYIIQAGGDINGGARPVNTENLILCPMCDYPVSPYAEECAACKHPVRQHFENIHREYLGRRYSKWMAFCGIPGLVGLFGGQYLELSQPWGNYLMFVSLALLGLAVLFMKVGENITKGIR